MKMKVTEAITMTKPTARLPTYPVAESGQDLVQNLHEWKYNGAWIS